MITIISKRFLSKLNCSSEKFHFLPVYLVFIFLAFYQTVTAQICDKKTMVFFESDQYAIKPNEEQKLRNLCKQFSQKSDTFLVEIYAFTDSIASVEYNFKLAQNRFKSIAAYLNKNSASHFKIKSKIWGEAAPMGTNATEEGRAKNRRTEIYYFKMSGGRVTLKGKGGMELAVGEDYFAPRGICECNPQMMEIYTDAEAARAGIPMTTTDGCTLTTGGMISLSYKGQDPNRCDNVVIRIPGDKYDGDMEIWNAGQGTTGNWFRNAGGQLEYDEKTNYYTLSVKMCPGNKINLDKYLGKGSSGNCDSSGVMSIPELIRPRRNSQFRFVKSIILTKEGKSTVPLAKFRYRGQGTVLFVDSAISKEKIGYYFSGPIDKYVMECDSARCTRLKECWCYEIPISAYTRIIYFQKKDYRLKVPVKYRNYSVRLFIPGADTIIPVTKVKGSRRKYTFEQPLPDTYVVLYKESSNPNNKRGYDYQVDLEKIHKKYSKRKKVYKARIKRRQLKHAV